METYGVYQKKKDIYTTLHKTNEKTNTLESIFKENTEL